MKVRRNRLMMLALLALLPLGAAACGKKEPPPTPAPAATDDEAERARLEAERRAAEERARREAEERAAAERAAAERARKRAVLEERVFFDYDQDELRPDARATLDEKVRILREEPGVTIRIIGHADERGSTEYNLALGGRRAQSIKDYLAGYGIAVDRMSVQSMGEEQPLERASNEAAWARNRRGEFVILAGLSGS